MRAAHPPRGRSGHTTRSRGASRSTRAARPAARPRACLLRAKERAGTARSAPPRPRPPQQPRAHAPCSTKRRLLRARSCASRSARLSSRKRSRTEPHRDSATSSPSKTYSGCSAVAPSSAAASAGLSLSRSPLRSHHTVDSSRAAPGADICGRRAGARWRRASGAGRSSSRRRAGDASRATEERRKRRTRHTRLFCACSQRQRLSSESW